MRALILMILAAAACDDDSAPRGFDMTAAANSDLSATPDLAPVVERGPFDVKLSFEPSGLWWDAPSQALYIASTANQISRWTDADGLTLYATVPFALAPQTGDLGQLVRLSDGRLVVTVRGAGINGNVVIVASDGTSTAVPGLNQKRQRVGLTLAEDGTLYDGWFSGTTTVTGGLSKLDLTSGESDVLLGLSQPAGVLVSPTTLFAADAKANALIAMPLSNMDVDGGTTTKLATITAPNFLSAGPGTDLFLTEAGVDRVTVSGTVTTFATETRRPSGVAYDAEHGRLFVGDPDTKFDADAGLTAAIHVMPVD
jgi:hypothetical protein